MHTEAPRIAELQLCAWAQFAAYLPKLQFRAVVASLESLCKQQLSEGNIRTLDSRLLLLLLLLSLCLLLSLLLPSLSFINFIRTRQQSRSTIQEAQLSPRDRTMCRVSWNLANLLPRSDATVQKPLVRQVLNEVSAVANWPVRQNRAVDSAWRSVR